MAYSNKYGSVTVENDSVNNPLNGTDEPVFLLRSQDMTALMNLKNYAELNREMASELEQVFSTFVEWQERHPLRVKKAS